MTQIELRKVAKTFGAKLILRDATCRFDAGTVSLITGENGAGVPAGVRGDAAAAKLAHADAAALS